MKKHITNIGAIILFYLLIVFGVLLLNMRFAYLNKMNMDNNYIAMNN